ncbi:extracellular solute-binding protein [Trueperella pyogenes]|uniref:extracellular solute-binding protein n=1 Tax=Trueperella pyogenes TaxID=1661 RepID=UPI000D2577F6|nr:extracellular solute-binding protein [Trueperella pyogenes]AWA44155.1 ABC transporter substrate-binding protein [Trueperella pyogenes]UVJ54065.1 extracellular solute-binding protein [Trueperella pyogenes]
MKLTKKITVGVVGFALALSGCGMNGGAKDSSSAASADDPMKVVEGIGAVTDDQLKGQSITLARFFGDCDDTTMGVTDISKATNECEAIQILTNQFVDENKWGIKVERLGGATWHSFYDGLNAALASADRPDVTVMHGSNLPDYASRGALLELNDKIGVDLKDATDAAADAVKFGGKNYAVPFDIHATVAHLNMDILKEAGLTKPDGTYEMPTTPEKFLADAEQVKSKTGKNFIDIALSNDPMGSRLWMALVWQQGEDFIDAYSKSANATSESAKVALGFINELVNKGYTTPTHDYDASQQAFLRGDSAMMYNGVWAVDQYSKEAPFKYQVADAPMLFSKAATWANSHTWAIPVQAKANPVKYRAAVEFVKFLYEHTGEWAVATGHMASAKTALLSEEYKNAPHREEYLKTAMEYAHMQPRLVEWPAISAEIQQHVESTWLNKTPVDTALENMQKAIENSLK